MLLLVEHMNLKVPLATGESDIVRFYVNALGAPVCPTGQLFVAPPGSGGDVAVGAPKQMHVNFGLSQVHFEWCNGQGKGYQQAQRLAGCITIAFDSLDLLRNRLVLQGFSFFDEGSAVVVADPFGCTWRCVQASPSYQGYVAQCAPIRAGGYGSVLGIVRVDFDVESSRVAESATDFFVDVLGGKRLTSSSFESAFHQVFSFNVSKTAPPPDAYDTQNPLRGIHFCVYISDFESIAAKAFASGLVWINPDYRGPPVNDNVDSLEKAVASQQFRLKKCGKDLVLEFEVRGLHHKLAPNGLQEVERRAVADGRRRRVAAL